jgi:endoglucanase Acf2
MTERKKNMKKRFNGLYRMLAYLLTVCMMLGMVSFQGVMSAKAATVPYLLSQNRPVFASSYNGGNTPDLAVDGDTTTRWDSQWGVDPQWIYIDLGANASITSVMLQWENAHATAYHIDVSTNELNWTTVYTTTTGAGGIENLNITATGRYVRLYCTARSLPAYGYSLYEFQVNGTGGVNTPPVQLGPNIALNKTAVASSVQTDGGITLGSVDPKFAVDGDMTTRWASTEADNEWIYVDLGATHQIGRVILNWESAYGRAYDIQVSNDANTWTTVYRQLKGGGGVGNIPLYVSGRYVRMLGIARGTSYGYSLLEFQVYDYVAGDPQPTYTIPPIPVLGSVSVGSGSYETNNITSPQPDNPQYKTSNVNEPLPSNKWWTSLLINQLGNGLVTLPLKDKFTKNGLSILNPGTGYSTGGAINADGNPDLYLMANNINPSNMTTKISGYGDYSANVVVSDNTTNKMQVTLVKGSPYIFTQFSDPTSPFIYSPIITRFFDDNNNAILTTDGASVTTDHIGIEVTNQEGPNNTTFVRDYGVFAPVGTVFQRVGTKVKITLGGGNTYLSVATLPASNQLNFFYQHAYAFVTDTKALYNFNQTSSNVTTNFQVTTTQMRTDLKANTLMAMLPTQWKISSTPITTLTFPSIRGTMKVCDSNTFTTVNKFYGIIPNFAEPTGAGYSRDQLETYLATLDQNLSTNYMNADPYWQGKSLQPLACAVIICDQIGDTARRDKFLGILRNILEDWYTYTNGEPNYYFFYNSDWGTILPPNSGYGVSTGMDDHHYTYGYFVFASAVLATYDKTFLANYGGMVEQLIRDYANPSRTDTMYPYLRNFDTYEGHSWAGGYGDNDSGCNEEATDECLFSWVGEYLWGIVTSNNTYRDAGIYGFTTEEYSIEQYWFNYDGDNWASGYPHGVAGQVWGSGYLYGTYFSGDPDMIYGIQWLPTAEYTSYYGRNPAKAATLYQAFLKDNGGLETTWYDIIWPFESLGDPQGTLAKWDPTKIAADGQSNDTANSYWFICSMASAGERTMDIWSTNYSAYSVFKNGTQYTAQIWNPTNAAINVSFANAAGNLATVTVPANSTVNADPTTGKVQLSAPTDSLTGGTYTGAQGVTLGTIPGATIHYTTDGSTPTASSPTYTAPFNVTATTTVKAIAVEAGLTNSPIMSETYTITAGNKVATPTLSLAAGKYIGTQSITISCSTMGAAIHYTTDGSTPTASSPTYTGTLSVSSIITLNAIGTASGLANSAMVTAVYTVTPPNIALGKTATASSVNGANTASLAVDSDPTGTRWESVQGVDPQWIEVDLGANHTITGVQLSWETAAAKAYSIQVLTDNTNWTTVYSESNGVGGVENISFIAVSARYVRMYGTARTTQYGYSLWDFEVLGS